MRAAPRAVLERHAGVTFICAGVPGGSQKVSAVHLVNVLAPDHASAVHLPASPLAGEHVGQPCL